MDAARRAALDALHDIGQRQFRRDRQEHVDMIASQHAFHDMYPHFIAGLDDDLPDPVAHRTLVHLVPIFGDPHDVEPVVKSRVRG